MRGYFWLPQAQDEPALSQLPTDRVAGTFVTDDEGPWKLELLGSLLPPDHLYRHGYSAAFPNQDRICGFSSRNTAISLFDTWRSSFSTFSTLLDQETWGVGWYSDGDAWVEKGDRVDSVKLEYDILSEWAGFGTRSALDYDQEERTLKVPSPETIQFEVQDAEILIHLGWDQTVSPYGYDARPNSCIEIRDDLTLSEVKNRWVSPLQTLLSFLTIDYVDTERVLAGLSGTDASVKLHYNVHRPANRKDVRSQDLGSHILASPGHFSSVGLDLQAVVHNFLDLMKDSNHEAALWFLRESGERMHEKTSNATLLNAFRALERYHAAAIGGTANPKKQHRDRVNCIVESSPHKHREWVHKRLSGANAKGLKHKLDEVLERATGTADEIDVAWPGFFDSTIPLRSIVAHGHPQSDSKTGLRYYASATGLRWILRHVYLREFGLSDQDAEDIVSRGRKFQDDLRLLRGWCQQMS